LKKYSPILLLLIFSSLSLGALTDDQRLFYEMNSSTIEDYSGNAFNPSTVTASYDGNTSYQFVEANSEYVNVGSSVDLKGTFTINVEFNTSSQFNITSDNKWHIVGGGYDGSNTAYEISRISKSVGDSSYDLQCKVFDGTPHQGSVDGDTVQAYLDNTTGKIDVTCRYTGTEYDIFIEGNEVTDANNNPGTGAVVSNEPTSIGALSATGSFTNYFDGFVDSVRFYNRSLTDSEINKLANKTVNSETKPAKIEEIYHLRSNDTSTPVQDFSGNNNDGTVLGSPTFRASGVSKLTGKWDNGHAINYSESDYLNVSISRSSLEASDVSYSLWVNGTCGSNGSREQPVTSFGANGLTKDIQGIQINTDCTVRFFTFDGSDNYIYYETTETIQENSYSNIVASRSGSNVKISIDNTTEQGNLNSPRNFNITGSLVGASRSTKGGLGSEQYSGSIDEVRLLNRSANSTIVSNLYSLNSVKDTFKASTPVADWLYPQENDTVTEEDSSQTPINFSIQYFTNSANAEIYFNKSLEEKYRKFQDNPVVSDQYTSDNRIADLRIHDIFPENKTKGVWYWANGQTYFLTTENGIDFSYSCGSPVISAGSANYASNKAIRFAPVRYESNNSIVFFDNGSVPGYFSGGDGSDEEIGYVQFDSDNPCSSYTVSSNPVLSPTKSYEGNKLTTTDPRFDAENNVVELQYGCNTISGSTEPKNHCYANGSAYLNGTGWQNFSRYSGNPTDSPGANGTWYSSGLGGGQVIELDNGSFIKYFNGFNDNEYSSAGYAYSSNGIDGWTGYTQVAEATESWEGDYVFRPFCTSLFGGDCSSSKVSGERIYYNAGSKGTEYGGFLNVTRDLFISVRTLTGIQNNTVLSESFSFFDYFNLPETLTGQVKATQSDGQTASSDNITFTVNSSDSTPPTSSDNWTATGFVNQDSATVEITATDTGGSGVADIYYRVNGGSYSVKQGSSATVTINTQGNNSLEYYAEDSAGNTEATNTEYVALESNSAPTASFTTTTNNLELGVDASGSSDTDGSISQYDWDWTNDDNYEATGQTTSHTYGSEGTYSVKLRVTDNDGAVDTQVKTISVSSGTDDGGDGGGGGTTDTTPPDTTDNWDVSGFLEKTQAAVSLSATDSGVGVDRIEYQVNGNGFTSVSGNSASVDIFTEGNNTLEYYAVDNNGNEEQINTEYVAFKTSTDGGSGGDGGDGSQDTVSLQLESPQGDIDKDGATEINQVFDTTVDVNNSGTLELQVSTENQTGFTAIDGKAIGINSDQSQQFSESFKIDYSNISDSKQVSEEISYRLEWQGDNGYSLASSVQKFRYINNIGGSGNNATGLFSGSVPSGLGVYLLLVLLLGVLALPLLIKVRLNDD